MVEKKLQEDINTLWNSKLVLTEKVTQFEADNNNFVITFIFVTIDLASLRLNS
jgi:hypothetical protein